jgi:CheY-like chemotaxis protein
MYGEALKAAGFDVWTFADPFKALDSTIAAQPGTVVTRILQPGFHIDGLELTRQIRQHPRTREAAVLAITSRNANVHRAAVEAGCDCILMLPCLPDELIRQIRQAVTNRLTRRHCERRTRGDHALTEFE